MSRPPPATTQVASLRRSTPVYNEYNEIHQRFASMPLKTNHLGHVPPIFVNVFKSYATQSNIAYILNCRAYRHVRSSNKRIRNSSMEGRDTNKLNGSVQELS
jgi:hypothetical protein